MRRDDTLLNMSQVADQNSDLCHKSLPFSNLILDGAFTLQGESKVKIV